MLVLNESDQLGSLDDDRHALLGSSYLALLELNVAHEVLLGDVDVEHLNFFVELFDFISLAFDSLVER